MRMKRNRVRAFLVAVFAVGLLVAIAPGAGATGDGPAELPESRIVGGSPASDGEYPYQVAMLVDRSLFPFLPEARPGWAQWCGGSVIDPDYILTAAHCVIGRSAYDFQVLAGTRDIQTGGDLIEVDEIIMHPAYDDANSAQRLRASQAGSPGERVTRAPRTLRPRGTVGPGLTGDGDGLG